MQIINLTPHDVVIRQNDIDTIYEASGQVARIFMNIEKTEDPLFVHQIVGTVENLPEYRNNVLYIVSALVFNAVDRIDVIAPNTNDAIRNAEGQVIAVPNFIRKRR